MYQTDTGRLARHQCAASDIDNAVQETLMILSRKLQALKAAAASSGWPVTIVRRACQRLSRKLLGSGVPVENLAEAQNATRSDFAALTIAEMAELLRMQVPGIKRPLHHACELLREYLVGPGSSPQSTEVSRQARAMMNGC
jgi:DNA-directed RNA polymerase specialized sigma24 family protein